MSTENSFSEKLPAKSKFAFGSANMASGILSGIGLSAITFFYNFKLGLDEDLIGIAWLIFMVWNAINDPLLGYMQDRTKSKLGRRIPYLRYGAPIYGLLFILIWFPFVDVSNETALFLYFLFILFVFDTIFTIVGLITYTLPAEMAISSKERSSIMVYSTLIGGIGLVISFLLPMVLLTGDESQNIDPTFLIAMVVLGILCSIIMYIASYYIKENEYTQKEETLGFFASIKETLKNKPFLIFQASNFSNLLANTIITSATFYYVEFVLDLEGILTAIPLVLVFSMVFIFTLFFNRLIPKYGLKKVNRIGLIIGVVSFILLFFIGWEMNTAIFGLLLLGVGLSAIMLTGQIIFADTVDYDETLTGLRRETTYSGVEALITKPAVSIAMWLFMLIISAFGFDSSEGATQPDTASMGIMIGFTILPAIFLVIGFIIMRFYSLDGPEWDKKKKEINLIHEKKEKEYIEFLKNKGK
ncbi:MAG: MFS transporter [archaeon]|nr:MFS transporter [archaeon]